MGISSQKASLFLCSCFWGLKGFSLPFEKCRCDGARGTSTVCSDMILGQGNENDLNSVGVHKLHSLY